MKKLLFASLLFLTGCISMPAYVALSPEAKSKLHEVSATSVVVQDEIVVVAQDPGVSRALGGGLLAAMIDSSITKSRQQEIQSRIEPFYDSIDEVDFRKDFWTALVPYLKTSYPIRIADVKTTSLAFTRSGMADIRNQLTPGKGFMIVGTGYRFTPDYSRLVMVTGVDIWEGGQPDAVYSNVYTYQSAPPALANADFLQAWAADSGKSYRAAITDGIQETIKMFRLDMDKPRVDGKDPTDAKPVTTTLINDFGHSSEVSGPALEEAASRVIMRNTDGRLLSLPRQN